MATEPGNPELMSEIARDGLDRNLDKGEFILPPETGDYLIKSEKLQETSYVMVETTQIGFKARARVPEDEIFLESASPPIAKVASEETSGKEETNHNIKIPYRAETKKTENGSQREKDEKVDIAEEKESKMNDDVDEIKDAVEKGERDINIVDNTGIISHEEKIEKSIHGIEEEKATREETTFEQVQTIASEEEGSLRENEEEGREIEENVTAETTKVRLHESGLGQNEEAEIQTADLKVNNSNTGVETFTDACEKTEIKEGILGTETTIVEENVGGKIVEELRVDSESCFNEKNVSKTIETTENEKENAMQVSIGEAYSIVEASPEEKKKEAITEIGEAVEGKPNEPSAMLGDVKEDDNNGDNSELLDVKGISEKGAWDSEKEVEQNFQTDKPGEKLEKSNKLMSAETDTANYGEMAVDNPEEVKAKSPKESVKQDVKNVQNDEERIEASNREILEMPDTARTGESIAHETKENDKGLHASLPTLLVKEEESLQEGGNITPAKSFEKKQEEDRSIVMAIKENISSTRLECDNQESEKEILQHQDDVVAAETEPLNLSEKADDITTVNETVVIHDGEEMIEKFKNEKNEETAETKATKVLVEEDTKVVAETSDANEVAQAQAVEATSTTGEIEVEELKKTYELDSMEKRGGKNARENVEEQANKEDKKEGYGENENAVLEEISVKHIISEQFGANISLPYSGEEAVLSHQEDKEEEKTKEEIHKEPEKNSEDKDADNQATEEAKIVNDQSIKQSGESVTDDNVKIKVPQPEIVDNSGTARTVRERESLQGGGGNITPAEALSEEDKEAETTIESVENNVSSTRPDDTHQESGKEKLKVEEDVIQDLQKSAPGEQLEQSAEMAAETETLNLYEKADGITSAKNAEVIQIVEETMGKEKEGGTEDIDEAKVKKAVAEEDTEVVASDSKEGMEIEAISSKSTAGETKLEILEKTCESVSKENPEGEIITKNTQKIQEDIEEEHGDIKNADLNDDAIQHIIVEKHIGTDASPQYSGEETAVSYKDEAEAEAKTRKEAHEEPEKNIVDKSNEKQAPEEANREINQSTDQSGEAVAEDDAKEYEIIQIAEKSGDDGRQTIESCATKDNFEVPVTDTDKEGIQQEEDKSDAMKIKENVENLNSGSIEQLEARGYMEAIESETLKSKEEQDSVTYPVAEVQALVHESNGRGVGISSWEIRSGEEVTVKEESSVNESISVSITALATETIVKEPEDLDSLMKGTINVEEGALDKVVIDTKPEDAAKLVEKVDHKIPAATDKAEETKQKTKTESEVQGNENPKVLMTTATSGDLQEDNLQESSTSSSKEFELKKSVASEITDEIPTKDQTAHKNAETFNMPQVRESVQSEDETTNVKKVYGLGSVDRGIESKNENLQGYEEHVSSPGDEKMPKETRDLVEQEEIHKSEAMDLQYVESPSERDDALKCMESIGADRKETILHEEDSTEKSEVSLKEAVITEGVAVEHEAGDYKEELKPTETNKYGTLKEENLELAESGEEQESASERVTLDPSDGTLPESIPKTVEDIRNAGLDQISESIAQVSQESHAGQADIEEKAKPELDYEKPNTDEMIETVISVDKMENSKSTEQLEAMGSVEAIESETLKDKEEPDNVPYPAAEVQALVHGSNERGVGISSWETRSGEEVAVKEESSVIESISVSITALETETIVREPEDLDSLTKGTIDVEGGTLDKVDINAKPEDASKPVEKVDHKIPGATDKAEEETKQEAKTESEVQGNENPKELMITVTASGDLQEDNLQESFTLSSKEFELKTSEESEIIEEIPKKDQTAYNNAETLKILQEKESAQNEDETTNAIEVSGVGSVGSGIEATTTENVQPYEEHVSSPREGEMPKMEETTDLVDQEEICKSETLDLQNEESPSARDDALKCMESTGKDRKETILGEEDTAKKSEVSLKEAIMMQEAVVDYEVVDDKQELEPTDTNRYDALKGENLELAESGQEQKCSSARVTSDQSDGKMPQFIPNTVEEIRTVGLDQSSESIELMYQEFQAEIEKKAEPQLDVEGLNREMQDKGEMIKTVIPAKKVNKEVQRADGDETVKETKEEENDIKEIHTIPTAEGVDEVKETSAASTEYLLAKDSDDQTEIVNLDTQAAPSMEKQILLTKDTKGGKVEDEGSERPTVTSLAANEESGETIKEIMEEAVVCSDETKATTVIDATQVIGLEEAPIDDTKVHVSSLASGESIPQEVAYETNKLDGIALEESSSHLASQLATADQDNLTNENIASQHSEESQQASEAIEEHTESEVTTDRAFPEEISTEHHQIATLALSPWKEDHETKGTIENVEKNTREMVTREDENLDEAHAETVQTSDEIKQKKESFKCISKSSEGIVATKEEGTTSVQPLNVENIEEQYQTSTSELLPEDQEHGTSAVSNEQNANKAEVQKDNSKTIGETFLCREETKELKVPQIVVQLDKDIKRESEKKAHEEEGMALYKIKEETEKVSELISESDSHVFKSEGDGLIVSAQTPVVEQSEEQHKTPSSALCLEDKVHETSATTVSTEDMVKEVEVLEDESKTTKDASLQTYEPNELEISHLQLPLEKDKQDENPNEVHEREVTKKASELVSKSDPNVFESVEEGIIISAETPAAEQLEDQNPTPSTALNVEEQEHGASSTILSMEDKRKEAELLEDETKTTGEASSQTDEPKELELPLEKDAKDKNPDEVHERENGAPDETKEEDSKATDSVFVSDTHGPKAAKEDEINIAMPTQKSEDTTPSASLVSKEQDHETAIAMENTEQQMVETPVNENPPTFPAPKTTAEICFPTEETRDLELSGFENETNKGIQKDTPAELVDEVRIPKVLELHPQEYQSKKIDSECPAEFDKTTEVTGSLEETSNLITKTSEEVLESVPKVHDHEILNETEEAGTKDKDPEAATNEFKTGVLIERTTDTTDTIQNEVTNEESVGEKEDGNISQPVTLVEEATKESSQKHKLEAEESPGEETTTETFHNKELHEEIKMGEVEAETKTVEDFQRAAVENEIFQEEQGQETSRKEGPSGFAEASAAASNLDQREKTSVANSEQQTSNEAKPCAPAETVTPTKTTDIPQAQQEPLVETTRSVDIEALQPGQEIAETASEDSGKFSLLKMMQRSTRERQAAVGLAEEKETITSKAEPKVETVETGETKSGGGGGGGGGGEEEEEEEDEHKKNDSSPDAPVMVEATKGMATEDVKAKHKKSHHNILSGVGSKVKHSISKVKKAITGGKSSHPKQHSPK